MLATLRNRHLPDLVFLVLLIPFSLWVWSGVPTVPFHPDEATFLFMSADWEIFLTQPARMAWQPDSQDPRQTLRLLDAPVGRYLIGTARWISGQAALPQNWDWSKDWEQNRQAGALPATNLLTAGRFGQAFFFPFSILLLYITGVKLHGRFLGWSAALLLAINALFLLHGRRAQAEGATVFFICLTLACLVYCRKRPVWIAIPAALAFCAKQSAFPLIAMGPIAIWAAQGKPASWKRFIKSFALYGILYAGIVIFLNPFLWAHPIEAAQAAISARQAFLTEQTREFGQLAPDLVLDNPIKTSFSFLVNLYFAPPSFAEAGNYLDQTRSSMDAYLSLPANQLFRTLPEGGVLLVLTLLGCVRTGITIGRAGTPGRLEMGLVGLAGALLFLALTLTVTLPFQRYVLPLIPFTSIFAALGLESILQPLLQSNHKPAPV